MATGWSRRVRVLVQTWLIAGTGTAETSMFAGLDTNTSVNDDGSNVVAGTTEPSSSNGYSRKAISWGTPAAGALDATVPALNDTAITWTSSGGGFSTGATTLKTLTIWNTSTLATVTEAAFCGRAAISVPRAVDADGVTLTCAISALSMGMISS